MFMLYGRYGHLLLKVIFPQRKFSRECSSARNNTFRQFREWLDNSFALGCPSEEEWEAIKREDQNYDYKNIMCIERETESGDLDGSSLYTDDRNPFSYNENMHSLPLPNE
jgi:hypothetical protein